MRVRPPTEGERRRVSSVAAVANIAPLVGVLALRWNVCALLALYWIEGLVTVLLAALKALFAERGSPGLPNIEPLHELRARRGGWHPVSWMPAVCPRNVPFAASILGFWTVAVFPVSVLYWLTATSVIRASLSLLVGGVGLVITQLHESLSDYLGGQGYAEVVASARSGSYCLRYGRIAYRRYAEQLVAFDTVLETVQWTAPVDSVMFSIRNAIPDRLLDTGTLEVSGADPDDRDAQLGPVTDLDATIETLELPVADPPLHRT